MANAVNGTGIYGYGDERDIFDFTTANGIKAPASLSGVTLKPGGAVYVYPTAEALANFTPSGAGANLQFVRINP